MIKTILIVLLVIYLLIPFYTARRNPTHGKLRGLTYKQRLGWEFAAMVLMPFALLTLPFHGIAWVYRKIKGEG